MTDEIAPGALVRARTAENEWVLLRAASSVTKGADFPIIWLLEEEHWGKTVEELNANKKAAMPWPAEDVKVADDA